MKTAFEITEFRQCKICKDWVDPKTNELYGYTGDVRGIIKLKHMQKHTIGETTCFLCKNNRSCEDLITRCRICGGYRDAYTCTFEPMKEDDPVVKNYKGIITESICGIHIIPLIENAREEFAHCLSDNDMGKLDTDVFKELLDILSVYFLLENGTYDKEMKPAFKHCGDKSCENCND